MSRRGGRRTDTVVRMLMVIVVVTLILGMILASAAARAQSGTGVTFDAPSGSGTLSTPLVFRTAFRSDEVPDRVELLSRTKGSDIDVARTAQVTPQDDGSYVAELVQAGFTAANTSIDFRFRVTTPSGVDTGPTASVTVADDRFEWRTKSDDTVTVHWYEGDDAFAERALRVGQDAIDQAASLLGVTQVDPVDFFIYATEEALRGALGPGAREHVGGQANPAIRTLVGRIGPSEVESTWIDTLVTHELTHMVFADATSNPYHQPPRWLNEGLAVYLSEGYGIGDRSQVADAAGSGSLIPLAGLVGLFPTTYERFSLAYAESVAAVSFFIDTYGKDKLVQLITSYRDGVTDDDAFLAATGSDFAAFDAAWIEAQGAAHPEPYGPLPAPAGPLPADWMEPIGAAHLVATVLRPS
jgi:hypothetical protein